MKYLVKRAQRGDKEAFVELMELYKQDLYKVAKSPSLGVSTIIFWSLFRLEIATVSINADFFCFLKT